MFWAEIDDTFSSFRNASTDEANANPPNASTPEKVTINPTAKDTPRPATMKPKDLKPVKPEGTTDKPDGKPQRRSDDKEAPKSAAVSLTNLGSGALVALSIAAMTLLL